WGDEVIVRAGYTILGQVDLEKGDGHIAGKLPAAHELTLRVLVDGVPRLPAEYQVFLDGATLTGGGIEEAALGRVHVKYAQANAKDHTSVSVLAAGFLQSSVRLAEDASDPGHVTDIELKRAGVLLAHVL